MSIYNRVRLTPEQRKRQIIEAACKEAIGRGLYNFSVTNISRRLKDCSKSLIRSYFSATELQAEVIREAFENDSHKIIAQAITNDDKAVAHLCDTKKKWHLQRSV